MEENTEIYLISQVKHLTKEMGELKRRLPQACKHSLIELHGHPAAYKCKRCGELVEA